MLTGEQVKVIKELYEKGEKAFRNIAIIAHVDHGKTTLSDSLLAAGGMMNEALAGSQLVLDNTAMEQQRGITINSSAISFGYKDHFITLIDTPGHSDFNSEVVKALRNVDGAILLIDCLEGLMTQTQTVLSQAIKEGVKVILFLNKVDRMINQLYMDTATILQKLQSTIKSVNTLIQNKLQTDTQYFNMQDNVIFGSALGGWGTSVKDLRSKNATFRDIKERVVNKDKTLAKDYTISHILLDTVIEQVASPAKAQHKRLSALFQDRISELPEGLLTGSTDAPFLATITDVNYSKVLNSHIATVKVWSGTLRKKDNLFSSVDNFDKPVVWSKMLLIMNKESVQIDHSIAGSIVAVQGLKNPQIGQTLTTDKNSPCFPNLTYGRESNVLMSIKANRIADTNKLLEHLQILSEEDPTFQYSLSSETNEIVIAGVGTLHLEVTIEKLKEATNIEITTSSPRVSYAQSLDETTPQTSIRTANKHNDLSFYLQPLSSQFIQAIKQKQINQKTPVQKLMSFGFAKDFAKKIKRFFYNGCCYVDHARGALYMAETAENLQTAIELALSKGPKIGAPLEGVALVLTFCKLHEDPRHRSLSQLVNAFREGVTTVLQQANTRVTEPGVHVLVDCPLDNAAEVVRLITARAGRLVETRQSDLNRHTQMLFQMPLSRTFKTDKQLSLSEILMSTTKGRAVWTISSCNALRVEESKLK